MAIRVVCGARWVIWVVFLLSKPSLLLAFHMLMPSGRSMWDSEGCQSCPAPPHSVGGGRGEAVASSAICHHIMPRSSRMENSEFP